MTAPNLLSDDGSPSIATAIMMSHHAFRRDAANFARALADELTQARADALAGEWRSYRGALHGHHEAEDNGIFPNLKAAIGPVIEKLTADHRRIDPLLERGDRAFAGLPGATTDALAVVRDLLELLDAHLAIEEAEVIPLLRGATAFPPPATDAEAGMYAEGFAWSSHGIAPDVLEVVYARLLPEALRVRMPAARAAFEARCERVWGTAKAGAARTPIPDRQS
jgi:hypothetical protein